MGGPRLAPHSPQFSWARDRPGGGREGLPAPGSRALPCTPAFLRGKSVCLSLASWPLSVPSQPPSQVWRGRRLNLGRWSRAPGQTSLLLGRGPCISGGRLCGC